MLWELLEGRVTEQQLVGEVVARYGEAPTRVAEDIHDFLTELLSVGAVVGS
jgi:hypothetical protein